jgi:dUTP pyrophosphatase
MESVEVQIQLEDGAILPQYATALAAGMDVHALESATLAPGERTLIRTGLRVAIPEGFEIQVRPRSGLAAKHGITLLNTPGTIDADFRGEIKILAINLGTNVVELPKGDRIAQLVLCPVVRASWSIRQNLEETERGEGGFGSTGTR